MLAREARASVALDGETQAMAHLHRASADPSQWRQEYQHGQKVVIPLCGHCGEEMAARRA